MNTLITNFMKVWRIALDSLRKLSLVFISILSLITVPAESSSTSVEGMAIDRVDSIREKLLRHDSEEKTNLAQWPNWPNWPNWGNWGNWGNWPNWGNWANY